MVITTTNFISDTVLLIRDRLAGNVTDPISGARPSASKFVVTAFPDRTAIYPMITVRSEDINVIKAGAMSEVGIAPMEMQIRVWARNEREKDHLTQAVINSLRTYQHDANEGVANNLYNFELKSAVNVDEEGKEGIKSRVMRFNYLFVLE